MGRNINASPVAFVQKIDMKAYQHKEKSTAPVCPVVGENLHISRQGRELLNVSHIAFGQSEQPPGCTMVVGPNGAGKSVLVRTLCDLVKPDKGSVRWAGQAPDVKRRHRVGLMLQKPVLLRRSAMANLVYALRQSGVSRREGIRISSDALDQAGLAQIADVQALRLSGGEQQRLALVRALLLNPDILFLDEATANVDPASTYVIEQQLRSAIANGLSVVMVSHDQGQVKRLGEYIVLMDKGRVLDHAGADEFFARARNSTAGRWIAGELLV